ncbi:endo-1,4-beta-xylanase [Thalassotalea psychrophila]|uniref:endo-1,4-beta-xylanase n=1 Tax=Thalassotalea psychrophila TaxID=3065647 RepID=A0ABY9TWF3_9GAMM|nr:endo-1,4-beta-xylanase [Colwelliaceae bacterium SQ149]
MKSFKAVLFTSLLLGGMPSQAESSPAENNIKPADGRRYKDIVADKYPENVYIGGTIQYGELFGPKGQLLNDEFSYITPANIYKQSHIHSAPGKWQWQKPDHWIAVAKQNNQLVRIHGPISPQVSKWAKNDKRTAVELETNLIEFMGALAARYNNEPHVKWLDVVNETITEEGTWFGPKPGVTEWENPWTTMGFITDIPEQFPLLKKLGVPKYIVRSFIEANKYAPNLKMVINQHRMTTPESIALMKELVIYLRTLGLRVDAIGWQAHFRAEYTEFSDINSEAINTFDQLIKWSHANNFEFHVTENNIHLNKNEAYQAELVGKAYANIVQTLLNNRKTGVVSWNAWTITDGPHFRNQKTTTTGIWNENYQPQKAYYDIQKVLEQSK